MSRRFILLSVLAAGALLALPTALGAASFPPFPGAFLSAEVGREQGAARPLTQEATHDGRTFRVTGVLADPEQTVVSYRVEGGPSDGGYITPWPGPRLVLEDGTVLRYLFIAGSGKPDGAGSVVFPPLPRGRHEVTLEVDGLQIARSLAEEPTAVNGRFTVNLPVDNEQAYGWSARSSVMKQGGRGKGLVTVAEVSRTPSVIVVRGTIDGLTVEEIQRLGRPNIALLTADGRRIESESGRLGFGEDYRGLEARFPAVASGNVTLEVSGLSPDRADDAHITLNIP